MSTQTLAPFAPQYGYGQTVAPTTSSASVTVAGAPAVCLTNLGAVTVYVRLTAAASTATAADYPVPAGAQVSLASSFSQTVLSFLAASGTGSLHIITGEGA
jgi:hypothetical protein